MKKMSKGKDLIERRLDTTTNEIAKIKAELEKPDASLWIAWNHIRNIQAEMKDLANKVYDIAKGK